MTEVIPSKSGFSHLSEYKKEESFVPPKKNNKKWLLALAAAGLLISGSYDSIASKLMNKQHLPKCDGCKWAYFQAPVYQTWTMYLGETCCLLAFYVDWIVSKMCGIPRKFDMRTTPNSFAKLHCPVYMWIIPAFFDLCATVMVNYAVVLSQASTVQLLRNFNVVVTAVLSLLYIRKALRRHQVIGVSIVTLGLIVTGFYALVHPDTQTNYTNTAWVGILLALIGTLTSAFQYVFEESLFRKYYASPFEAVGCEGVSGLIMTSILLVIFQFIPNDNVEKTRVTFYQMGYGTRESLILILANVSYVLSISIFNASGMSVSKLGSGLLRTILNSARTITIWVLEMIIGWNTFQVLNFIGLIITLAGVLTYNYNYFLTPNGNIADTWLRHPLMCCAMLHSPDEVNTNNVPDNNISIMTDENNLSKESNNKDVKQEEKSLTKLQSFQTKDSPSETVVTTIP